MIGFGEFGELADRQRAFQQRIGGVHVQVHKTGVGLHRDLRVGCARHRLYAILTRRRAVPILPLEAWRGEPWIGTIPKWLQSKWLKAKASRREAVTRRRPAGTCRSGPVGRRHGMGAGQALLPMPSTSIGDGAGRGYPRQTGMTSGVPGGNDKRIRNK